MHDRCSDSVDITRIIAYTVLYFVYVTLGVLLHDLCDRMRSADHITDALACLRSGSSTRSPF